MVEESGPELSDESALDDIAGSYRHSFMTAEQLAESFVRAAIMRGLYRPGDRLPQEAIAKALGISRIPVRSGLRHLEDEGLITITPHRGAIVTGLEPQQVAEIYELRIVLECYLLERCLERITPSEIDELRRLADEVELPAAEMEALARRVGFYERLYGIGERPQALKMVARLRAQVDRFLLAKRVVPEPVGHKGLLDCIEAGDLDGARRWVADHLGAVSTQLQALVAEPGAALQHGSADPVAGPGELPGTIATAGSRSAHDGID